MKYSNTKIKQDAYMTCLFFFNTIKAIYILEESVWQPEAELH